MIDDKVGFKKCLQNGLFFPKVSGARRASHTIEMTIGNSDLSDPKVTTKRCGATVPSACSQGSGWGPLDIDLTGFKVDEVIEVKVSIAQAIADRLCFAEDEFALSAIDQSDIQLLSMRGFPPATGGALNFYVENDARLQGVTVHVNFGVVFTGKTSGTAWQLPVLIDPKIRNGGGK